MRTITRSVRFVESQDIVIRFLLGIRHTKIPPRTDIFALSMPIVIYPIAMLTL